LTTGPWIGNLRIVTIKENNRNLSKSISNTSSIEGVSKMDTNHGYVASIYGDGKKIRKSLFKKFGDDQAKQMAIDQIIIWKQQFNSRRE
jgi:hypothetical protein